MKTLKLHKRVNRLANALMIQHPERYRDSEIVRKPTKNKNPLTENRIGKSVQRISGRRDAKRDASRMIESGGRQKQRRQQPTLSCIYTNGSNLTKALS